MGIRSAFESAQVPIAGFGTLVCLGAIAEVWTTPPVDGDGFVTGLGTLVLYVIAWLGFVVTGLGLAIPASDGPGSSSAAGGGACFSAPLPSAC